MGLLIGEKDVFDVKVAFEEKGNSLIFYESNEQIPETAKKESFTFHKPRWIDMRRMMSESIISTGSGIVLNPYVFMDIKIKQLLQDWTLTDTDGKKMKITPESIDNLNPALCDYLNEKIDEVLGTKEEVLTKIPEKLP